MRLGAFRAVTNPFIKGHLVPLAPLAPGEARRVGSAPQFGVGEIRPSGLTSHNGILYMVGQTNDTLYEVGT